MIDDLNLPVRTRGSLVAFFFASASALSDSLSICLNRFFMSSRSAFLMRCWNCAGGNTSGSPVNYARFVEFGTKNMYPRLFMGRAMQKIEKDDVIKDLQNLLSLSLEEK